VRIGVYGGSFDPPHIGHRVLAVDAAEALDLDRLFVVPTGVQPLKTEKTDGASAEHRVAMARLAFAGVDRVEVDQSEVNRSGLSFTVDTLESYAAAYPGAEIFLLIGRDSYQSLDKWKNPERIRELSRLAILERGDGPDGKEEDAVTVATRRIDISSSEIRERVRLGKPIAGFVPDAVLKYIESNNLYAPKGA
jgi:nicotinate-nucleotide adenylyltransferase